MIFIVNEIIPHNIDQICLVPHPSTGMDKQWGMRCNIGLDEILFPGSIPWMRFCSPVAFHG